MRLGLIINRLSGQGTDDHTIDKLLETFEHYGTDVVLCQAMGQDIDKAFTQVASHHPDAIVAAGGDGTIRAVAAKLVGTNIPLGVLPLGTANHFAADAGLPSSIDGCIQVIARGKACAIDVAEVNGHFFLNNSSIGLYPLAVRLRKHYEQELGLSKTRAMVRAMVNIFRGFPSFSVRLETDKGEYLRKTAFVFVGNNEYVAGKRESLTSGSLSVFTAHMKGRWGVLLIGLLSVINRFGEKYFDRHLVKELELHSHKKRMIVSLDGEVVEMEPPLRYRIHPRSLHLFQPEKDQ